MRFYLRFIICIHTFFASAVAIAETTPVVVASQINDEGEVVIDWKIRPRYLSKKDSLQILRRVSTRKFKVIKEIKATRKGTWIDSKEISEKTEYKIRLVQNSSRVIYSHNVLIVPVPEEDIQLDPVIDLGQLGTPISSSGDIKIYRCPGGVETVLFDLINEYRVLLGLPALINNSLLTKAAEIHSQKMSERFMVSHDGWFQEITNTGYSAQFAAQNIARFPLDPPGLLQAWLNSEGHKDVIEAVDGIESGISCVVDTKGYYWWTLNIGAPF